MKNSRGILFLIVAAYIGYLGIKLIRDCAFPTAGAEVPENPVLFIIFGAAFLVAAVIFAIQAVKGMKAERESREAAQDMEGSEEASEEDLKQ